MHGGEKGMLVISFEAGDAEGERLRELARGSGPAGYIDDVPGRGPDLVLMDHMDNDAASMNELSRYADQKRYEAGFGHKRGLEELSQLMSMVPGDGDDLRDRMSGKLDQAQRDMDDYKKFGGDVVSMELDRDAEHECPLTEDDDGLLSWMTMADRPRREVAEVEEALNALREDVGSDAAAEVMDVRDGVVVLKVSTPRSDLVYGYDVRTVSGRFQ